MQTKSAWERTFRKFSPSTDVKYSPLVQIQGKVKPNINDDDTVAVLIWALVTREEYYYQNFIELISLHKWDYDKTNNILRLNRLPTYWPKRLINFSFLGQGAFGHVYMANDAFTDLKYALKQVTTFKQIDGMLLRNTISIMTERNAHFRANESPFIVKLHGAFQDTFVQSYWLVFEYCIGDLTVYLSYIKNDINGYYNALLTENILDSIYEIYRKHLKFDVEKIGFIFGFELLAGLDYLATRNLLHNDLKPDNVLVSIKGHIKISDLGLTHRFRWLDRWSAAELLEPSSFKRYEEKEKSSRFIGNIKYADPEVQIYYNMFVNSSVIYKRIRSSYFPLRNIRQNFLSDLFGVALIIIDLLFVGMNILTSKKFNLDMTKRFKIDRTSDADVNIWPIRCVFDKDVNQNYVNKIFDTQSSMKNYSIMKFLKSCIQPREQRAWFYSKKILHMRLKENTEARCVDITKIEDLEYYKNRGYTEYNITTMDMPDAFINLYKVELPKVQAGSFDELLNTIEKRGNINEQELRMIPFEFAI